MTTEAVIRQKGKSVGIDFPLAILETLGLAIGQTVSLEVTAAGLLIRSKRKHFTAAELTAQCDLAAPMPDDLAKWDAMKSVGNEIALEKSI